MRPATTRDGMLVTEHTMSVPLDHSRPDGTTIEVFAREIVDPRRRGDDLPCLLFLQGGPGGQSFRPVDSTSHGWLGEALRHYRVVLLDQRGTGRSTPVNRSTLDSLGTTDLTDYLRHFRADSIVADAELLRARITGGRPWETLGQSYGGFITLTYLSQAPAGLSACYVAGGLPGIDATADDVYARTYPRVRGKNENFYRRFPDDRAAAVRIARHLAENDVTLPDGDPLTVQRFQHLGMAFGFSTGYDRVHWLLEQAWAGDSLSEKFLYDVMNTTAMSHNPLFAVMQETLYGQGKVAADWAADRALANYPEFAPDGDPLLFTGEMMYRWMFREARSLRPFAEVADALAQITDWPPLYDAAKLAANEVPIAAIIYFDDMYVDSGLSLDTAGRVGNMHRWVTNEWEHDGLHSGGERVFSRLRDLAAGRA